MSGFELIEGMAQRLGFVGTHAFDEMHQRSTPITDVGRLVERINHQPGDQLVTTVNGCVLVSAIISDLQYEVLARQALQHRHDGRVREVAVGAESLVDLTNCLGRGGVPQVVHDRPFQIA